MGDMTGEDVTAAEGGMPAARPTPRVPMRERIVEAATELFYAQGLRAVSAEKIIAQVGITKVTFYRHFPTKDDLIAAIVLDRISALSTLGERLLGAADAGQALLEFLTAAAHQRQQRDLSFLQAAGELSAELERVRAHLYATIGALVDRAREHGAVRPDITGTDVILLMCAPNYVAGYAPGASPDLWRRYLAIIFDGLRPEAAHPLPLPPPAMS